jgi:dienelactone hydrolase
MAVFIVSDIFGVTPSLITFAKKLEITGQNVFIFDPYEGIEQNFVNEAKAYSYFSDNVGLDKYAESLQTFIEYKTNNAQCKNNILIGFSIGASAIWKISEGESIKHVEHAFIFYGSQIRKLTHIQPKIRSTLIFPAQETHFSVDELEQRLASHTLVSTKRCTYMHGFMNPHSVNFNERACTDYTHWLCNKITKMFDSFR